MIRRLTLVTLSAVAGMALMSSCLGPAKAFTMDDPVPMAPSFKESTPEQRKSIVLEAYKIAVLYNYCKGYATPNEDIGQFAIWMVAQGEGLTLRQAAGKLDEVSRLVWQGLAKSDRMKACLDYTEVEADWAAVTSK